MQIFKRSGYLVVIALLISITLAACGEEVGSGSNDDDGDDFSERTIQVVATTGQIADAASIVGGDRVDVYGMMGPGVDPHLYRPTPEDTDALEDGDIVFYNGLNLEGRMGDLLVRFASQKPTVPVAAAVPEEHLAEPPEFEGKYDPHVWFDPALWTYAIREIESELADLDPDHAEGYAERADEYIAELEELEEYAEGRLSEIPEESRVLVTAHDAFGYFGLRWGYEVRGLQGISTATEAGARDVQDLAEFLVERDIKAVFVESSVSGATVEAVIQAANDQGGSVSIGGELYSDAMGDPGTEEGTYLGMYRHNVDTIVDSLK